MIEPDPADPFAAFEAAFLAELTRRLGPDTPTADLPALAAAYRQIASARGERNADGDMAGAEVVHVLCGCCPECEAEREAAEERAAGEWRQ
jgi:hypothetical protein